MHFGLHGMEPKTLEQIGRAFAPPISRERVRQIEERAFQKIRDKRREVLGQFLKGEVP
jgi:RNA polymerase primary sigma factor